MTPIIEFVKNLPDMVSVGAASEMEVKDAELALRLSFSDDYREYLLYFGAVSAKSIELTGIIDAECYNVISATKQSWELNPKVPHSMYVIEDTYIDGIIVWQDTAGTVYQTQPNSAPTRIASSLKEYLSNRTSK